MRGKNYIYSLGFLIVLFVLSSILNPSFFSVDNLITILRQASILLILSLGLTAVVLTGNIDLSVGASAALTGCVCAQLLVSDYSMGIAITASLIIGLFVGIANGVLVGILKLPSFVATYGIQMVVTGLATIVMNGGIIYGLPQHFTRLGIGYIGPVPIPIIIAGILFILMFILLEKTSFGREVHLIGYNTEAARYASINSLKVLILSYILSGLSGSLGGIIMTSRLNAADAGMSETYGLQIVAAVVIGGTSLLGGEGGVPGTVIGSVVLTMVVNIMNIYRIDSNWQNFAIGFIILVMVWFDIMTKKRRK